MLRNFIEQIEDSCLRDSLLQKEFNKIVCYPGSGLDPYPCVLVDTLITNNIAFTNDTPLFVFCDPLYNSPCSKEELLEAVSDNTNARFSSAETSSFLFDHLYWYGDGLRAYSKEFYIQNARVFTIPLFQEMLYFEVAFEQRTYCVLFAFCDAEKLFIQFANKGISVDLVLLWDEQSWCFSDVIDRMIENHYTDKLPLLIVRNRAKKFLPVAEDQYNKFSFESNDKYYNLICECRGIIKESDYQDYDEDICCFYLKGLTQFICKEDI